MPRGRPRIYSPEEMTARKRKWRNDNARKHYQNMTPEERKEWNLKLSAQQKRKKNWKPPEGLEEI